MTTTAKKKSASPHALLQLELPFGITTTSQRERDAHHIKHIYVVRVSFFFVCVCLCQWIAAGLGTAYSLAP